MLRTRQIIPALNLHTPDGRTVRAWDFKQKKNLVIVFLDLECAPCEEFFRALAARAGELREKEAVALGAFLSPLPERLSHSLPEEIIAGADISGRGASAYLGDDAFASRGLARTGVFVVDRYGELFAQWVSPGHKFPTPEEILSWLDHIGMACDECSVPQWPADA
jgi:AhpC/TSA family